MSNVFVGKSLAMITLFTAKCFSKILLHQIIKSKLIDRNWLVTNMTFSERNEWRLQNLETQRYEEQDENISCKINCTGKTTNIIF